MRIIMGYGKNGLPLDLPDNWDVTIIKRRPMPILVGPAAELRRALSNPVGSRPLAEEAMGRCSACILICDITRPVPNSILLPVIVKELIWSGIDPANITVLVATGMHRPNEGTELRELVGDDWVLETVQVVNHFARNDEGHVYLGTTRRGTPVKLDRRFVEADLRIVTGLIEPHFMAGYSGGRKVITPGVAHWETIASLHSARLLENPNAVNCVLDGNPLHEEMLEIVQMAGGALGVNTVIDDRRRLSFVNFGETNQSHLAAVSFLREYVEIPTAHRYKTVVTCAAGYPLDKTYYQTVKGMVGALEVLDEGGNLFIVSECSEGMGSPDYVAAQEKLASMGADLFLAELLMKRLAAPDEWQTLMQVRAMRAGAVHLYTDCLSEPDLRLTGVHTCRSLPEAITKSVRESKDNRVAVIPEGPYVVPRYGPVGDVAPVTVGGEAS